MNKKIMEVFSLGDMVKAVEEGLCPGRLRGTPHQSLLELGNILFHDARPTNEIESTGIKKYWLSKSRIIPYKKIK